MTRRPRKSRNTRAPRQAFPSKVERRYQRDLLQLVQRLSASVRENLIPIIPSLIAERDRQVRVDSWVDDIVAATTRIRLAMTRDMRFAERDTIALGREIADFNATSWRGVMRKVVGVDFLAQEPWLNDEIKSFAAENVTLIRDIPDKAMTNIQGIVQRGVRSGLTARELEAEIQQQIGSTAARARLIARDQVSKLNGQITSQRQQALGVRTYYWDTAGDERVRKAHRKLDGLLCRWDNDRVYSSDGGKTWKQRASIGAYIGKPGQDIQCRCSARADTNALLDELGI